MSRHQSVVAKLQADIDKRQLKQGSDPKDGQNMLLFRRWIDEVPEAWLRNQLLDLYWKGHLKGHTVTQAFECAKVGVDLIPSALWRKKP